MKRPSRDIVYIEMAYALARRGTCVRRSVGCILTDEDGFVLSMGYNGVPAGRPHCNEELRCAGANAPSGEALDTCQAIHAEQNALIRLPDYRRVHTAYCTSSPCVTCVKLFLGTKCQRIVFSEIYPHPIAQIYWEEAGREWIHLKFK